MIDDHAAPTFDLLVEPWIPCEILDGSREELGLRDVLSRAHEIRGIEDPSPLTTVALHRLLLAILDRALAPRDRAAWIGLWDAETLPAQPISEYLDRWAHRFDLFHPERPFLQVAKLEDEMTRQTGKAPERTPLWRMILETSVHSSPAHLFERIPEDPWILPGPAARGLLSFLLFAQGGRIQNEAESWRGGSVRGGAAVLALGDDLGRTLLLNLIARSERHQLDLPPWERPSSTQRVVRSFAGLCDQLIFPVRRVELFPERDGTRLTVRQVVTGAGERCDDSVPDPMFAYFVRDPKKPPVALRIDPDRSAWRDANALFDAATGAEQFRRPLAVSQIAELIAADVLHRSARLRFGVFGLASDQAKILLWRAEVMPAPTRLIVDADCVDAMKTGLQLAEAVGQDLEYKVLFVLCERALAPTERDADKGDIKKLRHSLGANALYWASLGAQFPRWLVHLEANPEEAVAAWKEEIRRAARAAFDIATHRLGVNARSLAASAQSERTLYRVLTEHLSPSSEKALQNPTEEVRT